MSPSSLAKPPSPLTWPPDQWARPEDSLLSVPSSRISTFAGTEIYKENPLSEKVSISIH